MQAEREVGAVAAPAEDKVLALHGSVSVRGYRRERAAAAVPPEVPEREPGPAEPGHVSVSDARLPEFDEPLVPSGDTTVFVAET